MTKLRIDGERCVGHGRCYDLAPDLFVDDDRGYGQVTTADVSGARLGDARLAARSCPEHAVLLGDEGDSAD